MDSRSAAKRAQEELIITTKLPNFSSYKRLIPIAETKRVFIYKQFRVWTDFIGNNHSKEDLDGWVCDKRINDNCRVSNDERCTLRTLRGKQMKHKKCHDLDGSGFKKKTQFVIHSQFVNYKIYQNGYLVKTDSKKMMVIIGERWIQTIKPSNTLHVFWNQSILKKSSKTSSSSSSLSASPILSSSETSTTSQTSDISSTADISPILSSSETSTTSPTSDISPTADATTEIIESDHDSDHDVLHGLIGRENNLSYNAFQENRDLSQLQEYMKNIDIKQKEMEIKCKLMENELKAMKIKKKKQIKLTEYIKPNPTNSRSQLLSPSISQSQSSSKYNRKFERWIQRVYQVPISQYDFTSLYGLSIHEMLQRQPLKLIFKHEIYHIFDEIRKRLNDK